MTMVLRLLALLPLFLQPSRAHILPQETRVYGTVRDSATGAPLPNVLVTCEGTTTSTDTTGVYDLVVPAGEVTLRCALVGYEPRIFRLNLPEGTRTRREIVLASSPIEGEEVAVTGFRTPLERLPVLNAVTFQPERAMTISGSFNDPYRTIQMLPGVASNNEMSSQFGVRGGGADENLVLLNGARVIEPFHLKESPNTGSTVIPLEAIGRVLFMPGGFPARYGDRLSSVLDLTLRRPDTGRWGGTAELSLANGAILVEGPLGGGAAVLVNARSSYSGYVASFLPSSERRNPWYYDLLAAFTVPQAPTDRLSATLLHAYDRTSGLADGWYATSVVAAEQVSAVGGADTVRGMLSLYRQRDDLRRVRGIFADGAPVTTSLASEIIQTEARAMAEISVAECLRGVAGVELRHATYDVAEEDRFSAAGGDSVTRGVLRRAVTHGGLFVENIITAGRWMMNAGFRADHVSSSAEMRFSPRALLTFRAAEGTLMKGAWGIYRQSPTHHQLLAAERAGLPPQHMQRAVHYLVGVDQTLRSNLHLRVEAYVKTLENLISFRRLRNGEIIHAPRNDARGEVQGVEFEAAFSDPRVFGWINVAVMRAEERSVFDDTGWRLRPTDQRKAVTTVFEIRMSERWSVNLRAMYGSGFAYGDDQPDVVDPRQHYPEYKRADVRVSFAVPLGAVSSVAYLEVLNVFGYRNAFSFSGEMKDPLTPDVNLLLPRVINVGVRARW